MHYNANNKALYLNVESLNVIFVRYFRAVNSSILLGCCSISVLEKKIKWREKQKSEYSQFMQKNITKQKKTLTRWHITRCTEILIILADANEKCKNVNKNNNSIWIKIHRIRKCGEKKYEIIFVTYLYFDWMLTHVSVFSKWRQGKAFAYC